ncbi:hypothetical protein Terro_2522 [Terriglobus roseus DSM 18391]|uniref:Uncharacterized protein n=1 Tax=Terriglobus roseus (strain DSM 18391 / NRRL B-41598 / KBS 63) TaxID=926566 RepID=I3ZHQ0_TERRK|nr:hypothetical protein Terro_2158 [Terriglobus roseus DSM 18391]AFL88768.1 hypothetical protein Terro_2522 [Terriglobus roseus DSM 18391]
MIKPAISYTGVPSHPSDSNMISPILFAEFRVIYEDCSKGRGIRHKNIYHGLTFGYHEEGCRLSRSPDDAGAVVKI